MAKKKSLCFPLGLFVIIAWFWGSVTPAVAETLQCKSETDHDVSYIEQLGDLYHGYFTRIGVVTCDNGETAKWWSYGNFAVTLEKGGFSQGYIIFTFKDFSNIVMRYKLPQRPDPQGTVQWFYDYTAEIIKGDGRFEGIKGSVSVSGKQLLNPKKTAIQEMNITYTLPPK